MQKYIWAVISLVIGLSACGGSSTNDDQNSPLPPNNWVNENNYVARAAYIFNTELLAGQGEIDPPELYLMDGPPGFSTVTSDCDLFDEPLEGQQRVTEKSKSTDEEADLSVGDFRRDTASQCNSINYRYNGTEYVEVTAIDGDFPSGEYWSVWLTKALEEERYASIIEGFWDGHYRSTLHYLIGEKDFGRIKFRGINLGTLYAGTIPYAEDEHSFWSSLTHDATASQEPPQGEPVIETPDKRYDSFAYESLNDNTLEFDRREFHWRMDLYYKDMPDASHVTASTRRMVLEDYSEEIEGETETVERVHEGEFYIRFDTGHRIILEVISSQGALLDGPPVGTVRVRFDADGDGESDYSTDIYWDAFRGAQGGIVVPVDRG